MKKTLTIIGLSLIGLLAIVTIILACVQSSFAQAYTFDVQPYSIEVYNSDGTSNTFTNTEGALAEQVSTYNKLLDLFQSSSKESVLTALLQGAYSFKSSVTENNVSYSSLTNTMSTNVCIRIKFNEAQTLKVNGKVYTDDDGDKVTYNSLIVLVNDSSNLTEYTIYTVQDTTSNSNIFRSTHQVTAIGKQADLYAYITEDLFLA